MKRILFAAALVLSATQLAYGQTAEAYINGAKARMSKNKWEDARKVLAEQIGNYSDNAEMHYLYSIALAKVSPDSTPKSIEHLAIADSLNGNPGADDELQSKIDQALVALWGPMVNDGVRLLSEGDLEKAEVKLAAAVEINPEGKEGRLGLGAVHQAKKEYDLAIEQYTKALEIDPAYKQALIRLGQTYQLKAEEAFGAGNTQQSEQLAAKAAGVFEGYLAENPEDIEIKIQLAGLHATLGNIEKAEPIIREVMTSDSVNVDVYADFGFALANAEQYDLAEEVLLKAVELSDSLNSEPLSYLAFVRIQKKDLEGARPILLKQIELEPDNYEAWEYLGFVRRDLGDSPGAQEAFAKAEAIPLELEALRMNQQSDSTWNVQASFSNRLEAPVQDIKIKFMLVTAEGDIIETKETVVAGQPLAAGESEDVTIEFATPAENPRIRFDIL